MRLKNWLIIIVILFYFGLFIFRDAVTLDPDFGWHLQFGRLVLQTQSIPVTDTYSYTMPSYHFINHEWGSGVLIASIYDSVGMWPLTVLFALISVSTLFFLSKGIDADWAALPLFLTGGTIFDFTGVRPPIFTWVFLALFISLLWHKKAWQKWRFFIPILFLIWANLHAGFCSAIFILGWFVMWDAIVKRRIDTKDGLVLVLSLLATLCNPYGYYLWSEVIETVTDQGLHFGIQEWYPAIYFTNLAFWLYVAISFSLMIRYYKHFSYKVLGLYVLLFLTAMSSMRNIPLFVVVSFYPTLQAITYFYKEASSHLYGKERFVKGYIGFFIICLGLFLPQVGIFVYGASMYGNGQNGYPKDAVMYLRKHLPADNIFSSYNWGGYLIWQLPEKKDFIDGRMPTWRNPEAPSNESNYAFGDYEKLMENTLSFAEVMKKYNMDAILVPSSDLKEQHLEVFGVDVEKSWLFRPFFTPTWSFFPIVTQVRQMGWKEVYHDKTATVFEKE